MKTNSRYHPIPNKKQIVQLKHNPSFDLDFLQNYFHTEPSYREYEDKIQTSREIRNNKQSLPKINPKYFNGALRSVFLSSRGENASNKINTKKNSLEEKEEENPQNTKANKKNYHKIEGQITEPSINKFDKNYSINFIKKKTQSRATEGLQLKLKMRVNSRINQRQKIRKQPDEIKDIFQIRKYGQWLDDKK